MNLSQEDETEELLADGDGDDDEVSEDVVAHVDDGAKGKKGKELFFTHFCYLFLA